MALTSEGKLYGWGWNKVVIIFVPLLALVPNYWCLIQTAHAKFYHVLFYRWIKKANIEQWISCVDTYTFFGMHMYSGLGMCMRNGLFPWSPWEIWFRQRVFLFL